MRNVSKKIVEYHYCIILDIPLSEYELTELALFVKINLKCDIKFKITIKCNFMTYDTCEKVALSTFSFHWHLLAF